jgi:hypothetical protein
MNPFDSEILHEEVHPCIAQHFTGRDLLTMSEVSTSWNEFAESKKFRDKIRLKIDMHAMKIENFKTITSSSRTFKDVSVDAGNAGSSAVLWTVADTAEKMKVNITDNNENSKGRDFPNLKSLDLIVDDDDSWILRSKMEQLEELKLTLNYGGDWVWDGYESVFEVDFRNAHHFLSGLKSLKRLDVLGCHDSFISKFEHYRPQFQLKHFKGDINYNMVFLKKQRESLESFSSDRNHKSFVRDLLSEFPKLITLELTRCHNWMNWNDAGEPVNIILPVNTTIKSLKLQFNRDQPVPVSVKEMLLALPELESLEIEKLTTETMELIALNLHKLKELKYNSIENRAWKRYEEMKRDGVKGMNTGIQLSNIDKDLNW